MVEIKKLGEKLSKIGKMLHYEGLAPGTTGNISSRLPDRNHCLIKPSGFRLNELNPNDFIVVNVKTREIVEGTGKPSIETPFHTAIYQNREDVNGIVHVHAHYTTVLSILDVPLKHVTTDIWEAPELSRGISVAEFAPPGSEELARNLVDALKDYDVAVMPHHGMVAVGESLEDASRKATVLERMAKVQYHAMLIGEPREIPEKLFNRSKKC